MTVTTHSCMVGLDKCHDKGETHRPMSYRPSSKPPRGAWARHLQEQRRLRDLSQTQAFELVYERVGWSPKSRTAYVAIDMGDRQPKGNEVTVLGAEFGWPSDPVESEATETPDALIAALAAQTAAINALVAEMRLSRAEQSGAFEGIERALRVVANIREDEESGSSSGPQSHGGFRSDRLSAQSR